MARHIEPDSVSSKISALEINQVIEFTNPCNSIAVMVSNLKKKEQQKDKIFKIKLIGNITHVTRIK